MKKMSKILISILFFGTYCIGALSLTKNELRGIDAETGDEILTVMQVLEHSFDNQVLRDLIMVLSTVGTKISTNRTVNKTAIVEAYQALIKVALQVLFELFQLQCQHEDDQRALIVAQLRAAIGQAKKIVARA